jgi:hypothetical protein
VQVWRWRDIPIGETPDVAAAQVIGMGRKPRSESRRRSKYVAHVNVKCADGRVKEYGLGEKGQLSVKLKQRRRTPAQMTEAFTFGGGEKESVQEVCSATSSIGTVADKAIPETVAIPVKFLHGALYGTVMDFLWEPAYGTVASEVDKMFGYHRFW